MVLSSGSESRRGRHPPTARCLEIRSGPRTGGRRTLDFRPLIVGRRTISGTSRVTTSSVTKLKGVRGRRRGPTSLYGRSRTRVSLVRHSRLGVVINSELQDSPLD